MLVVGKRGNLGRFLLLLGLVLWPQTGQAGCPEYFASFARNAIHTVVATPTLSLRYHTSTIGLDEVAAKGTTGILFLSNHSGLIDPIILANRLNNQFHPRPAMIETRAQDMGGKFVAWVQNAILVPDITAIRQFPGETSREKRENFLKAAQGSLDEMVGTLKGGGNLLVYPAAQLTPGDGVEKINAKSAVHTILQANPNIRIVLVDEQGLRGSSFAYDQNNVAPNFGAAALNGLKATLANGILFNPRRDVTLTFTEPTDFPRGGTKDEMNKYLEAHWAKTHPEPVVHTPYSWFWNWKAPAREIPQPPQPQVAPPVAPNAEAPATP